MATERIDIVVREDGSRVVRRNIDDIGKSAADAANGGLTLLKRTIATVVTGAAVNAVRQMADEYTNLQNRLRVSTNGQANLNAVFAELQEISARTRSSLQANTELYSKMAIAAKDLGVSQSEVLQFTESLNQAIKLSGASATEAEGGIRQLAQGLASGALRGDELNSVMENLPGVADVISKSLGITRGELRKMGAEGKITGDIILKAFRDAREELAERFATTVPTMAEGFQLLENQVLVTVGALDQATGSSSLAGEALVGVVNILKELTPEMVGFTRALIGALDPQDQLTSGSQVFATVLVTLYGTLKALSQLLLGTVLLAFKTVGRIVGGVVAAVVAALSGDFKGAFEIVKEASSDISTTWVDDSNAMANSAIETTSNMFERLDQIWNAGARSIQNRSNELVSEIDTSSLPSRLPGPSEKELAKQAKELEKLKRQLNSVLNEIDPLAGETLKYARSHETLIKAFEKGVIKIDELQRYQLLLVQQYQNTLDPLSKLNQELENETYLLGLNSREREIEAQMMQATQSLLDQNIVLTERESEALREKFVALQNLNEMTAAQDQLLANSVQAREAYITQLQAINALLANPNSGFTQGDAAGAVTGMLSGMGIDVTNLQVQNEAVVRNYETMYAQVAELRAQNLIGEQDAAAIRAQLWAQQQAEQLEGTSNFFGQLSALQKSENSRIAKIGKAAAIAQAIVQTYTAANSAYAAMASIPYIGPALGAAAAAAAIVAGMANVKAIRQQPIGFMQGGWTGNMGTSQVAGVVHGREYVMDAASTSRIGRNNLDALRSGDAEVATRGSQSSEGGEVAARGPLNITFQNFGTPKDYQVQQLSPNDVRIIARDEISKQTPELVSSEIGNPNSKISKAMSKNTQASRRR